MKYLIVGGTSEAGQSAIAAVREFAPDAEIIATSSKAGEVAGADRVISGVDLTRADAAERVVREVGGPVETMFFTPAFGPVGYPIAETVRSDVEEALNFSYHPLVRLTEELPARRTVAYSSFYWLEHIAVAYGSMGAVKYAVENLAISNPERYRVIRSGAFTSRSTRGISLLIQRTLKSTQDGRLLGLMKRWKESGMKFQEFFFHYAHSVEREEYAPKFEDRPHRKTTRDDLKEAALDVLRGAEGPIRNVIGEWKWTEHNLPRLAGSEHAAVTAYV